MVAYFFRLLSWYRQQGRKDQVLSGTNFSASRRLKVYIHLHRSEYNYFSERTTGAEPPFPGPHPNRPISIQDQLFQTTLHTWGDRAGDICTGVVA